jgi:hypothetical protein
VKERRVLLFIVNVKESEFLSLLKIFEIGVGWSWLDHASDSYFKKLIADCFSKLFQKKNSDICRYTYF